MARKVGITSVGFPEFDRAVIKFERRFINEVKRIVAETAEMIAAQAKALAPVDEGNLRRSIDVKYYNKGLSAVITVGANYALYVNYGTGIYAMGGNGRKDGWVYFSKELGRFVYTVGQRPQQFWEPAVERGSEYFKREMNKLG